MQPTSKTQYTAGETSIIRLPTNAIIDLHTLNLRFDKRFRTANTPAATVLVWPRYIQSLIRRLDVTIGGVQVGLGSLGDYGGAFNLLANNTVSSAKLAELTKLEGPSQASALRVGTPLVQAIAASAATPEGSIAYKPEMTLGQTEDLTGVAPTTGGNWSRNNCSTWLGLLGGQMMRFLDTNLLPDVELRITWNSGAVIQQMPNAATGVTAATGCTFDVKDLYLQFECIAFGDSSYRMASALSPVGSVYKHRFGCISQPRANSRNTILAHTLYASFASRAVLYMPICIRLLFISGSSLSVTCLNGSFLYSFILLAVLYRSRLIYLILTSH